VRVITRLVQRLGEIIPDGVSTFHNRRRAAKRRYQQIQRMTSSQRQTRLTGKYRELIEITKEVVQSAHAVLEKTKDANVREVLQEALLRKLQQEITHYCQLGERVLDQTRRRVLEGEQVPNAEKVFSIFESHTDLIRHGKPRTPEEFGHKVFLAESAQGLITQYEVLDGNPADQNQVKLPSCITRPPLTVPQIAMPPIEASKVWTTKRPVKKRGSSRSAFPNVEGRKRPGAKPTRRLPPSNKASVFVPASKGASRFCSAAVA